MDRAAPASVTAQPLSRSCVLRGLSVQSPRREEAAVTEPAECPTDLATRFAYEVEPHRDRLLRRARTLSKREADAEDLLQDTLLSAFRGFESFDGNNLQAWLFRIMQNRWISDYRWRGRRVAEVLTDFAGQHDIATGPEWTVAAVDMAADTFADIAVREAFRALPPGQQMALYYTDVEGYTHAETAAILQTPIGTVTSRVFRGRRRLRKRLADLDPQSADRVA